MMYRIIFWIVGVSNIMCFDDLNIYHEATKIYYSADDDADYFGYSVFLSDKSLYVGAPKARSRVNGERSISPGLVYHCPLGNMYMSYVMCTPLQINDPSDDMWFGAEITALPDGQLLICAPRWSVPHSDRYLLMFGACYIQDQKRWLKPLMDGSRLSYKIDGKRMDYQIYDVLQPYFSYGQAGMSVKVTEANTLIMGAPSLLQWAGGISEFTFYPGSNNVSFNSTTTNLYNTPDVGPNNYFGYSVESGIFEADNNVLYVAGAPKSHGGYGQRPVNENDPLNIKAKVNGPHLGSYFGASVCCVDVNGDGVVDLLVGAPTYVKDKELVYDQGAVFVYLTERRGSTFVLQDAGYVTGSQDSGANFGRTIAELGDIDGDGFKDVAIGAPFENNGRGAVYIYRGCSTGLKKEYDQRIMVQDGRGFGISISKGLDLNDDNCNDFAVGAYDLGSAYVFRCIPTMQVFTEIKVDTTNLLPNATNLTALFCINAPSKEMWPFVFINLRAKITIDPERNRSKLSDESEYGVYIQPGWIECKNRTIEILSHDELLTPIPIKFSVTVNHIMRDDSMYFNKFEARLSHDSVLHSSLNMQVLKDCGEDLICRPLLIMSLQPLISPFVPGLDEELGFTIRLLNKEEPTYGAKVYIQLPSTPTKVPDACDFEGLNVTCKVPSTLYGGKSVSWNFEMEYTYSYKAFDKELKVFARLEIPSADEEIENKTEELSIVITPQANFSISAFRAPNTTIIVTRDNFDAARSINFLHMFMVSNDGPSDWYGIPAQFILPNRVNLSGLASIDGCIGNYRIDCTWSLRAKESMQIVLPLSFNLKEHGNILEENTTLNFTSTLFFLLEGKHQTLSVTTTLLLEPTQPIWPIIVGCLVGIILLAVIVYILYKCGFFTRSTREKLKKLQEPACPGNSGPSSATPASNGIN